MLCFDKKKSHVFARAPEVDLRARFFFRQNTSAEFVKINNLPQSVQKSQRASCAGSKANPLGWEMF